MKASKGLSSAEDSTLIEFIMHENDMSAEMACARGREGDGGSDSEGVSDRDGDGRAEGHDGLQDSLVNSGSSTGDDVPVAAASTAGTSAEISNPCKEDETCWRALNSANMAAHEGGQSRGELGRCFRQ